MNVDPKPRCFRIPEDKAIINRFGINNKGVKNAVEHLKKVRPNVIVAANISKNTTSINEDAAKDYEKSFGLLYDFVDMFAMCFIFFFRFLMTDNLPIA